MRVSKLRCTTIVVIGSLLFVSCSSSLDVPSAVAKKYVSALADGDTGTVRKLLSRDSLPENLDLTEPASVIKQRGGINSIEVTKEEITGDKATVEFTIRFGKGGTREGSMQMIKESGAWIIAAVAVPL